MFFTTTGDNRVWALETATDRLEIIYDAALLGTEAPRGDRLHVTSQRGTGGSYGSPGMTFEIRRPFRGF